MESEKKPTNTAGTLEKVPGVSVIVPVYNRPDLVTEAVRSVLFQSHTKLECILVDDGSERPPMEALELFAADPRFRPIRIDHTGMPGAVRNRGVESARYDLIAFLDSDDLWLPLKLEKQLSIFGYRGGGSGNGTGIRTGIGSGRVFPVDDAGDRGHAGVGGEDGAGVGDGTGVAGIGIGFGGSTGPPALVHSREIWLRDTKIVSQKTQRHRRRGEVFADALVKCMIGPSTVLMQRWVFEELGGFREDLEIAEDYELWLRLTAAYYVDYIDEPLVVKRAGHGAQLSEKYGQIEIFRIHALRRLVEEEFFRASPGRQAFGSSSGTGNSREAGSSTWPGSSPEAVTPTSPPEEKQSLATAELARKCEIYAAGCRTRNRMEEAERYERMSAKYRSSE